MRSIIADPFGLDNADEGLMALAKGNRHGRQKEDGGNKKEGKQKWALFVIMGSC
ncbi:hypothetical protein J6590_015853 [Homalodisca vitripennis]|nr:hypothetical protein J6590_015853 [Homalodisca vitripennis]